MNLPEVRIKSSFLLNNKVIPLLMPGLQATGREYVASKDYMDKKVNEYSAAWEKDGDVILNAMCEVLGLSFKQNIIDAYVMPFGNSFSDPMVISTKYTPDRFLDVFTHELTHRLLTDNTKMNNHHYGKLSSYWKDLFGDQHSFVTLVHIPVHAVIEYIFRETLNEPSRVARDIELCKEFVDYALAWEYVQQYGYKQIINQLREEYDAF